MNRQEAEELLPWFVAGTLSDEEARAVQAFIDNGEISTRELEEPGLFAESVAEGQASEPDYDPEVPVVVGEVGSESGADGRVRAPEGSSGLIQRILDALQWPATPTMARVVVAAQFALLFGLAVMIATGNDDRLPQSEYGTVSGAQAALGVDLSMSFVPGTTEADLRSLLLEHKISIVSGPSALGLYQAAAPAGTDIDELVTTLDAHPLVLYVQTVLSP